MKYELLEIIDRGTFGEVFYAKNIYTKQIAAVKVAPKVKGINVLLNEAKIMIRLQKKVCVPRIYSYGSLDKNRNYIAMQLLGYSISTADASAHNDIFIQLISIFENLHMEGFIYRDVKPSNFLLGIPPKDKTVYIIDFGLAKIYSCNNSIISAPIGTTEFMSISAHNGNEQGRRDDMESLGYLMLWLINKSLPWSHEKDHSIIANQKREYKPPPPFDAYMKECTKMGFVERPNYSLLKKIFE